MDGPHAGQNGALNGKRDGSGRGGGRNLIGRVTDGTSEHQQGKRRTAAGAQATENEEKEERLQEVKVKKVQT